MRIASLSSSVTDMLVNIGLEDELVGATLFCLPWLRRKGPGDVVLVGDYLSVKVDRLKELRPDVVFLQSRVHDRFQDSLRAMELNVFLINLPSSVLDALSEMVKVSDIVGRGYEGRLLVLGLYNMLKPFIHESRRLSPDLRPRIYIEFLWLNWIYTTTGSLTFVNDMMWLTRGLNIFHDVIAEFFTARDEDVLRLKPRVIMVN